MYYFNHKCIVHFIEIYQVFVKYSVLIPYIIFRTYGTYHHIISRLHLLLLHQIVQHQKSRQVHIGLSINTK